MKPLRAQRPELRTGGIAAKVLRAVAEERGIYPIAEFLALNFSRPDIESALNRAFSSTKVQDKLAGGSADAE